MSYFNMNSVSNLILNNFELIVVSLFVTLIVITLFFMKNLEKKISLKSSELENPERYLRLLSSLREQLEGTRKNSYEMLNKANEDSLKLLKDSAGLSENMQNLVKKRSEIIKKGYIQELQKNSQRLSNQFQEEYSKEFAKGISDLKNNNSILNRKILEEAENLIKDVHDHLNTNHDLVLKKIDDDMSKTEEFLSTYRKNKIEEFDKEFKNMVNFYVKDYLKKTLSFDEHEEIIRNIMKDFEKSVK